MKLQQAYNLFNLKCGDVESCVDYVFSYSDQLFTPDKVDEECGELQNELELFLEKKIDIKFLNHI